ncbi:MAG: amylo-alpha-1,6-glucosidase [Desulfobacteraceae bacterium]|jgi:glycogen debranching enzyme|nr:amylo-alpha-1,6-glucosidase [Desulfobacteraceae bacterium]
MTHLATLIQEPAPGQSLIRFAGDVLTLRLRLPGPMPGTAWIRTNLGHAAIRRSELIASVEAHRPFAGHDWYDVAMRPLDDLTFEARLPLVEIGQYCAKCFFLPDGSDQPLWPPGDNVAVKVEPADTCSANIIYNAFVRQFGPNRDGSGSGGDPEAIAAMDRCGYTVIPPSGTFRDFIAHLDFIFDRLGCRIVQLLPIHRVPTTYARMGRFGSPYAALSFTGVDPALAVFDPAATPMEQFLELVDAIHAREGKLILDIAINHTGWAARLHHEHPEWLVRDPEGRIETPGAWGVVWADLARLDYRRRDLWRYMADVFLTWCRRGVDGFRCDAGYMVPLEAWRYIIAAVRQQFPYTLFFLEGLGGKVAVTRALLQEANFNWAYSELFQNYDRGQIEYYLPSAIEIAEGGGALVHFAETHDNNRLAARSHEFARLRTALCALCAHQGAFAFTNGVEWLATEKIDVHGAPSLNWGATPNLVDHLARLHTLLRCHPVFHDRVVLRLVQAGMGNHVVVERRHESSGRRLWIAANLDDRQPVTALWQCDADPGAWTDLLAGETAAVEQVDGMLACALAPGQVRCLSRHREDLDLLTGGAGPAFRTPPRALDQRLRAVVLRVYRHFHGDGDLADFDPGGQVAALRRDPEAFCARLDPARPPVAPVVVWDWSRDTRRQVMVPPDHFLLVRAAHRFRVRLVEAGHTLAVEDALPLDEAGFFALLRPLAPVAVWTERSLELAVYEAGDRAQRTKAPLLFLPPAGAGRLKGIFARPEAKDNLLALLTNGRGGMARAHAAWGELASKYDALLAANLDPAVPVDRWILLSRCRAWIVFQGYSTAVTRDCLERFFLDADGRPCWHFTLPAGQGQHLELAVRMEVPDGKNALQITFQREMAAGQPDRLADDRPVRLILRPDVEDRSFHDLTKAYTGPESRWPAAVTAFDDGFRFDPDPSRTLTVRLPGGVFQQESEWHYMVHRPLEAQRGMDPDSDLFSPGYFSIPLSGGQRVRLDAWADGEAPSSAMDGGLVPVNPPAPQPVPVLLGRALSRFVVRRDCHRTVIAGYPWFLDWGRDTLIVVRGLIADGRLAEARDILVQFARFEDRGTLPNMIRGRDASNRDTSDAPLWFCVACRDYLEAAGNKKLLSADCNGRRLGDVILDLGRGLCAGAPNGVRMDRASGLLFSPAHFTWMDTNHPAASPRQGYPVEIQALWHAALELMAALDAKGPWRRLSRQVRDSFVQLFWDPELGYFADCRHADPGVAAREAEADDALRPNQLFAVTLGVVADAALAAAVVRACRELLVPGAIRSLADRPVRRPLAVLHHGQVLNDPHHPYQGRYQGDEDTRRKPAYHNGTAWTWVFPVFCEAWVTAFGPAARPTARCWLESGLRLMQSGCLEQVPEILDGDAPHAPRGCDAQAWGVSELLRVWHLFHREDSTADS